MATMCFYQDSAHAAPLSWIRKQLGIGYVTNRNDRISELRINGNAQVDVILEYLLPFLRFKRAQAIAMRRALRILRRTTSGKMTKQEKVHVLLYIQQIQNNNYRAVHRRSIQQLKRIVGLTP